MSNQSLLDTINTGFTEPIIINKEPEPVFTFETGFDSFIEKVEEKKEELLENVIEIPIIVYERPTLPLIIPTVTCFTNNIKNKDSVKESVDTGFGCNNKVVLECPKPEYKSHLCRENYLGEYTTDQDKQKVRNNLNVYSTKEIDSIILNILFNGSNISKEEVLKMIQNADFIKSQFRFEVNYKIPENLYGHIDKKIN